MSLTKTDLKQIADIVKQSEARIRKDMATKTDLSKLEIRIESKLAANQAVNIKHHLETREMIGELSRRYDHLREGLARAANA